MLDKIDHIDRTGCFLDIVIAHHFDQCDLDLDFAAQVNAAGAVLVLRQAGQLPPVLPKGKLSSN